MTEVQSTVHPTTTSTGDTTTTNSVFRTADTKSTTMDHLSADDTGMTLAITDEEEEEPRTNTSTVLFAPEEEDDEDGGGLGVGVGVGVGVWQDDHDDESVEEQGLDTVVNATNFGSEAIIAADSAHDLDLRPSCSGGGSSTNSHEWALNQALHLLRQKRHSSPLHEATQPLPPPTSKSSTKNAAVVRSVWEELLERFVVSVLDSAEQEPFHHGEENQSLNPNPDPSPVSTTTTTIMEGALNRLFTCLSIMTDAATDMALENILMLLETSADHSQHGNTLLASNTATETVTVDYADDGHQFELNDVPQETTSTQGKGLDLQVLAMAGDSEDDEELYLHTSTAGLRSALDDEEEQEDTASPPPPPYNEADAPWVRSASSLPKLTIPPPTNSSIMDVRDTTNLSSTLSIAEEELLRLASSIDEEEENDHYYSCYDNKARRPAGFHDDDSEEDRHEEDQDDDSGGGGVGVSGMLMSLTSSPLSHAHSHPHSSPRYGKPFLVPSQPVEDGVEGTLGVEAICSVMGGADASYPSSYDECDGEEEGEEIVLGPMLGTVSGGTGSDGEEGEEEHDEDEDEDEEEEDLFVDEDDDASPEVYNNVLGPLSGVGGGTTGVVLEPDDEDGVEETTIQNASTTNPGQEPPEDEIMPGVESSIVGIGTRGTVETTAAAVSDGEDDSHTSSPCSPHRLLEASTLALGQSSPCSSSGSGGSRLSRNSVILACISPRLSYDDDDEDELVDKHEEVDDNDDEDEEECSEEEEDEEENNDVENDEEEVDSEADEVDDEDEFDDAYQSLEKEQRRKEWDLQLMKELYAHLLPHSLGGDSNNNRQTTRSISPKLEEARREVDVSSASILKSLASMDEPEDDIYDVIQISGAQLRRVEREYASFVAKYRVEQVVEDDAFDLSLGNYNPHELTHESLRARFEASSDEGEEDVVHFSTAAFEDDLAAAEQLLDQEDVEDGILGEVQNTNSNNEELIPTAADPHVMTEEPACLDVPATADQDELRNRVTKDDSDEEYVEGDDSSTESDSSEDDENKEENHGYENLPHGVEETDAGHGLQEDEPAPMTPVTARRARRRRRYTPKSSGVSVGEWEKFNLPIVYKPDRTGFEPSKDLLLSPGDVVAGQFLVQGVLGSAAFSTAYRCVDLTLDGEDNEVCLKVIKNSKDYFDQSLDEIKILDMLRESEEECDENNLLLMKAYFYYKEHLIIVTELLGQNLYEFAKYVETNNEPIYFSIERLSIITRQVLTALDFLHQMNLVHCDVKPENILLSSYSRARVKLIDFGSTCFTTDSLSSYIQSRAYRAPEVVLGLPYDGKIDIWSLGCVVAEMYTGSVFFDNDSVVSMLAKIESTCGPLSRDMIDAGRQSHAYFLDSGLLFEEAKESKDDTDDEDEHSHQSSPVPGRRPSEVENTDGDSVTYRIFVPKKVSLEKRLGFDEKTVNAESVSPKDKERKLFVDFVKTLLNADPDHRPTASEALQHPWILYGQSTYTEDDIRYTPT